MPALGPLTITTVVVIEVDEMIIPISWVIEPRTILPNDDSGIAFLVDRAVVIFFNCSQ